MDFKTLNFTIFCIGNVALALGLDAREVYHRMPNHQVCITSQDVIDRHLRFVQSIKL